MKQANLDKSNELSVDPKLDGLQKGWICPRCGRVNSPLLGTCPCSFITSTISTNFNGGNHICSSCTGSARANSVGETYSCIYHHCKKRGCKNDECV